MIDITSFKKGDRIEVEWADINEDPVGDIAKADLARRVSVGIFQELKQSLGIDALVTTTTEDIGSASQSGYCIYPVGCILGVKLVKRKRAGRKKKVKEDGPSNA